MDLDNPLKSFKESPISAVHCLFLGLGREEIQVSFSAAAVANEFLALGRGEGSPIDQMKLQKLIFYGHAWHLAQRDEPLIEEEIEAWPWGPVVRSVYIETAEFKREPISSELTALEITSNEPLSLEIRTPRVEDESTVNFIKAVWDSHKQYTGIQLSNSTHAPGEPWTIVKQQYGSLSAKPPIPNSLIKAVFKHKINAAAANPAA